MTPINIIRIKLVQEPELLDLEDIGARLEHHQLMIRVDNMLSSDCGDRWECEILEQRTNFRCHSIAPSLRTALIDVLKQAEAHQE